MNTDFEQAERYQELFNLMCEEHGLTLTMTEMDDIISEVEKLQQSSIFGVVQPEAEKVCPKCKKKHNNSAYGDYCNGYCADYVII